MMRLVSCLVLLALVWAAAASSAASSSSTTTTTTAAASSSSMPAEHRVWIHSKDHARLRAHRVPLAKTTAHGAEAYVGEAHLATLRSLGVRWERLPHTKDIYEHELARESPLAGKGDPWAAYHGYQALVSFLQQKAAAYPQLVSVGSLGTSVQNRGIWYARVGTQHADENNPLPKFKYVGNMHGDETVGREMILRLLDHLLSNYGHDERITTLLQSVDLFLVPSMNPDGFEHIRRSNANGIDLNRDFQDQFSGQIYAEQPEVTAVREWLVGHDWRFTLSANLHGGSLVANYPWDGNAEHRSGRISATEDQSTFVKLALEYSQHHPQMCCFTSFSQGITNGAEWYVLYGGMQDWNYLHANCMELTLELSYTKRPTPSNLPEYWNSNKDSMLSLIEAVQWGFHGVVKNTDNQPLPASVTIQGSSFVVPTNPHHGSYYRVVAPGTYTVTVAAEGYQSQTLPVHVPEGPGAELNVVLHPTTQKQACSNPLSYYTCGNTPLSFQTGLLRKKYRLKHPTDRFLSSDRDIMTNVVRLLDRALVKVALAQDDPALTAALSAVLVPILQQAGSQDPAVKAKTMKVLQEINTILKPRPEVRLPLTSLLDLLELEATSDSVRTFVYVYLDMGLSRESPEHRAALVARLLGGLGGRPAPLAARHFRLCLQALRCLQWGSRQPSPAFKQSLQATLPQEPSRAAFLSLARSFVLLTPSSTVNAPGHGLSVDQVRSLTAGAPKMSYEQLSDTKYHVCRYVACAGFSSLECFPILLVASHDSHHKVKDFAGTELKRLEVDLESPALVSLLFKLFLGTNPTQMASTAAGARVRAASPEVKGAVLSLLNRSALATNMFPFTIQVAFDSIFGASTSSKVQAAGVKFLQWVFRMAKDAQIKPQAPLVKGGLQKLLSGMGGAQAAAAASPEAAHLASVAYGALGMVAKRAPELFAEDARLVGSMFDVLRQESTASAGIVSAVRAALSNVWTAFGQASPGAPMRAYLLKLALQQVSQGGAAARYTAVNMVNRVFDFASPEARWVCLLAADDVKLEVRQEARRGLKPYRRADGDLVAVSLQEGHQPGQATEAAQPMQQQQQQQQQAQQEKKQDLEEQEEEEEEEEKEEEDEALAAESAIQAHVRYPPFHALLQHIASSLTSQQEGDASSQEASVFDAMRVGVREELIRFAAQCIAFEARIAPKPEPAAPAVTTSAGLVLFPGMREQPLHEPEATRLWRLLLGSAMHGAVSVAAAAAATAGSAAAPLSVDACRALLQLLGANPGLYARSLQPEQRVDWLLGCLGGSGGRYQARRLVAQAAALLLWAAPLPTALPRLRSLHQRLAACMASAKSSKLDCALIHCLGLGLGLARQRHGQQELGTALLSGVLEQLLQLQGHKDHLVCAAAAEALGLLGRYKPLPLQWEEDDEQEAAEPTSASCAGPVSPAQGQGLGLVLDTLEALLDSADRAVIERAAATVGSLCLSERRPSVLARCASMLYKTASCGSEEVHFTVGESLCCVGAGWAAGCAVNPVLELVERPLATAAATSASASAAASTAAAGTAEDPLELILKHIFKQELANSNLSMRCAAAVWLLALTKHTGRLPAVQPFLVHCQTAFSLLLADNNELTQEVASRGLVLVYESGSPELRSKLVEGLVRTVTSGTKGYKLTNDSQLFPEGALGAAPKGHGYSTYKQLVSLANDVGKPQLVHQFVSLASNHAIWSSKRAAAYGAASVFAQAREQLRPHLDKLVPRMYRSSFDPNPRVASSMRGIFKSLVPGRAGVDQYWEPIMSELVSGLSDSQWRVRQASCAALHDTVMGRDWAEMEAWLHTLWIGVLRSLDDIKESVRSAAEGAAKAMASLSLRLCDPHHSPTTGPKALEVVLPVLLDQGMANKAKEVRGLSVATLLKLVRIAGKLLEPHVPRLVSLLLQSLSSNESAVLSYMSFHTGSLGISQEQLEGARVKVSKAGPITEALDYLQGHVVPSNAKAVGVELGELLARGTGLPTRVASAQWVSSVMGRAGDVLRKSCPKLLRTLMNCLEDPSATVRKAYCEATAHVARQCKPVSMKKLVAHVSSMYLDERASETRKVVAATVLRDLAKVCPKELSPFMLEVIPLAWIGRHDGLPAANKLFQDVWTEIGVPGAVRVYLDEILRLCETFLSSSSWPMKRQAAETLGEVAEALGKGLGDRTGGVLSMLLGGLKGRTWEGKAALLTAIGAVCSGAAKAERPAELVEAPQHVLDSLLAQCPRKDLDYRRHALGAVAAVASALPALLRVSEDMLEGTLRPLLLWEPEAQQPSGRAAAADRVQAHKLKARGVLCTAACAKAIGALLPLRPLEAPQAGAGGAGGGAGGPQTLLWVRLLAQRCALEGWNVQLEVASAVQRLLGLEHIPLHPELLEALLQCLWPCLNSKFAVVRKASGESLLAVVEAAGGELLRPWAPKLREVAGDNTWPDMNVLLKKLRESLDKLCSC